MEPRLICILANSISNMLIIISYEIKTANYGENYMWNGTVLKADPNNISRVTLNASCEYTQFSHLN